MSAFRNARMAMWSKRLLAAAGLTLALGTIEVRADQIFTLSGVTFDDGGTATGTFTTNDALSALLDFDITTSGGTGSGFHYTSATADSSSTALPFILVLNTPPALDHILEGSSGIPGWCDQEAEQRSQQALATGPDVVNELEEPEVRRQLLLRDAAVRSEP